MFHDRATVIFKASKANFYSLNHLHLLKNYYFNSITIINSRLQVKLQDFKGNYFNSFTTATVIIKSRFIIIH